MDKIFIQHRFSITKPDGSEYSDAIVLPQDEYNLLTAKDIEDLKQQRLNTHIQQLKDAQVIANQPVTADVITQQLDGIQTQIDSLTQTQDSLTQELVIVDAQSIKVSPPPIIGVPLDNIGT